VRVLYVNTPKLNVPESCLWWSTIWQSEQGIRVTRGSEQW